MPVGSDINIDQIDSTNPDKNYNDQKKMNTTSTQKKYTIIWKCYRCNITFNNENISKIHKNITRHHIQKIKVLHL